MKKGRLLQEANCFHPLPGETSDDAKRRHVAFKSCWEETRKRIEVGRNARQRVCVLLIQGYRATVQCTACSKHQCIVSVLWTLRHCGADLDEISTHQIVKCCVWQGNGGILGKDGILYTAPRKGQLHNSP